MISAADSAPLPSDSHPSPWVDGLTIGQAFAETVREAQSLEPEVECRSPKR